MSGKKSTGHNIFLTVIMTCLLSRAVVKARGVPRSHTLFIDTWETWAKVASHFVETHRRRELLYVDLSICTADTVELTSNSSFTASVTASRTLRLIKASHSNRLGNAVSKKKTHLDLQNLPVGLIFQSPASAALAVRDRLAVPRGRYGWWT